MAEDTSDQTSTYIRSEVIKNEIVDITVFRLILAYAKFACMYIAQKITEIMQIVLIIIKDAISCLYYVIM